MKELSNRLIVYRAKHRLTQNELAKRCGVSSQTISNIENGYQKPNRVTLTKIALVIGEEEKAE